MTTTRLILRPDNVIQLPPPLHSDPRIAWAYLRGVDAGERHGYARARRERLEALLGVRDVGAQLRAKTAAAVEAVALSSGYSAQERAFAVRFTLGAIVLVETAALGLGLALAAVSVCAHAIAGLAMGRLA